MFLELFAQNQTFLDPFLVQNRTFMRKFPYFAKCGKTAQKIILLASQIVLQKIWKFLILARVTTNHLKIAFSP